ncbi:MAG: YetF domain-containing protein [Phototrophicaceae bacterium]
MNIFFQSWNSIIRLTLTFVFIYPSLILLLRIYGKRSLAQLNMFDFIITVALGSIFASVLISKDVTILDGILVFILLLSGQFIITWTSIRWKFIDKIIKSEPTIVLFEGNLLEDLMKSARVSEEEINSAIRHQGIACLDSVYAVVLENNGTLSVISYKDNINRSPLHSIKGYDDLVEKSQK